MPTTLHAVFIGINNYRIKPLAGCINDALACSDYFASLCAKQPKEKPIRFKPHYLFEPKQTEERQYIQEKVGVFGSPTRQAIIDSFQHFKKEVKAGDFCLFYYSGHGSTIPAPKEFSATDAGGFLQTLVPVLATGETQRKDVIDKELAYLIADVLAPYTDAKGQCSVHFLTIIDSCHSGSNTRGGENDIRSKMASSSNRQFQAEDMLGFTRNGNCFYPSLEGDFFQKDTLKHARHINLSAARDTQSALEMMHSKALIDDAPFPNRHGVFTYALLTTLAQTGVNISYAELIKRIGFQVRTKVDNQTPLLGKTAQEDAHLYFLKNEFRDAPALFEVQFGERKQEWLLNAGLLHGIKPSTYDAPTVVHLSNGKAVEVKEVRATESVLSPKSFGEGDKKLQTLTATVEYMAQEKVHVALDPSMASDAQKALTEQFNNIMDVLSNVFLMEDAALATYIVRKELPEKSNGNTAYYLCRANSYVPLFLQNESEEGFWRDVEKVARWENAQAIANPNTAIRREDFEIEALILEGKEVNPNTLNNLIANETLWKKPTDPDAINARYVGDKQPAIRLKIKLKNPNKSYNVACLCFDSQFGIDPSYMDLTAIGGHGNPDFVEVGFTHEGSQFSAVPLSLDERYLDFGVTETTETYLFFIAEKPFDLSNFKQNPIEMAKTRSAVPKGGFDTKTSPKTQDDWCTIKVPVRITRAMQAQQLQGDSVVEFHSSSTGGGKGFIVKAKTPPGFSALAQLSNTASLLRTQSRSVGSPYEGMQSVELPPAHLWDGTTTEAAIFERGAGMEPDGDLNVLEFTKTSPDLSLTADAPLLLIPEKNMDSNEAIIPFGFDADLGLYLPMGFTNPAGEIVVESLPSPTPGVIGKDGGELDVTQRSLFGSIKLFFQKIIIKNTGQQKDYNSLCLHQNGSKIRYQATNTAEDTANLKQIQGAVHEQNIVLLVHGIIGDTESMVHTFLENPLLTEGYVLLSFDYENLDTPIEQIAKDLHAMLSAIGAKEKSISIVAHSMGGLVSRYMIEHIEGHAATKTLIQLGTPNAGTNLSEVRKKMTSLMTLGLNGVTALKPFIQAATTVFRFTGGNIFHTLDQMDPKSPLYAELNHKYTPNPKIPYFLISGNTSNLHKSYPQDSWLIFQLAERIKNRGHYDILDLLHGSKKNDLAVTLESMALLGWGSHQENMEVPCDHISYFSNPETLELLGYFLQSEAMG